MADLRMAPQLPQLGHPGHLMALSIEGIVNLIAGYPEFDFDTGGLIVFMTESPQFLNSCQSIGSAYFFPSSGWWPLQG